MSFLVCVCVLPWGLIKSELQRGRYYAPKWVPSTGGSGFRVQGSFKKGSSIVRPDSGFVEYGSDVK